MHLLYDEQLVELEKLFTTSSNLCCSGLPAFTGTQEHPGGWELDLRLRKVKRAPRARPAASQSAVVVIGVN